MEEKEYHNLEGVMKELRYKAVSPKKKKLLKERVFMRIDGDLVEDLKVLAEVELDDGKKNYLKARIFDRLSKSSTFDSWLQVIRSFGKKFSVGVALFAFFVYSGNFVNFDATIVYAEDFTVLESFDGEVLVVRNGNEISAKPGFRILENDQILTKDGSATIRFFDDSVSRVAENTDLVFEKLVEVDDQENEMVVSVKLVNGQVWTRVLNLAYEDYDFVLNVDGVMTSTRGGAFNVEAGEDFVEIEVFNHSVDVVAEDKKEKVVQGSKVIVESVTKDFRVERVLESKRSNWVMENLESDRVYVANVQNKMNLQRAESLGVLSEEEVDIKKVAAKDRALMALTFDDVEKRKLALEVVEKEFIAAQIKLSGGKVLTEDEKIEIEAAMRNFENEVMAFNDFVSDVSLRDSVYGNELNKFMSKKITGQKKALSLILPDSEVYEAKKLIGNLEVVTARDEVSRVKAKTGVLEKSIADMETVVEINKNVSLNEKLWRDYEKDMVEVVDLIVNVDTGMMDKEALLMQVVNDVDRLEGIDNKKAQLLKNNILTSNSAKIILAKPVGMNGGEVNGAVTLMNSTSDPAFGVVEGNVEVTENTDVVIENKEVVVSGGVGEDGNKNLPPLLQ